MKKQLLSGLVAAAVLGTMALPASAQNIAIVNGKAVPKERAEVLRQQVERSGRPVTPDVEGQIKEEVIAREIFMQEAQKRGLHARRFRRSPPGRWWTGSAPAGGAFVLQSRTWWELVEGILNGRVRRP